MIPVERAIRDQLRTQGCKCRPPYPELELGRVVSVVHDERCRFLRQFHS